MDDIRESSLSKSPPPMHLPVHEKISYALGDVSCNIFWTIFSVYLVFFYTDIFGISAATAGTLLLVTRLWDSINNPLMGLIADRTKSRWGKFRPYLLWFSIPFAISAVLAFTTPNLPQQYKILYAFVTYTLMMSLYTVVSVPYSSLLGVTTPNSDERATLSSYRFAFALIAGLCVQFFTMDLVNYFGNGNSQKGFQLTISLYAVISVVFLVITFYFTKERVQPDASQKNSIKGDLADLIRNKPWLILFFVSLITLTYLTIRTATTLYYFKYFVGDEALAKWFLAGGSLCLVIGTICTKPLSHLFGKAKLFAVLLLGDSLFMSVFYFVGPTDYVWMFSLHFVAMLFLGPTIVMIWAMYADTADYSEWRTKRRATALVFSAAVFAQKMGAALGSALLGWALASSGFTPNAEQSSEALHGIRLSISIYPGILSLLAAVLIIKYPLEANIMERIGTTLGARRQQASRQFMPNT